MQNIKQHDSQPSLRAKGLVLARFRFDATSLAGIICLPVCMSVYMSVCMSVCLSLSVALLSGCSGFGTDSFSGDALSSRSILPPEISPAVQAESELDIAPDDANKKIDQLAQMVGATAQNPFNAIADATANSGSQEVNTPAFRFSTELPDEPDFDNEFQTTELAAPVLQKNAKLTDASTSDSNKQTESVVRLVAATQPIGAGVVIDPNVLPEVVPQPLRQAAIENLPSKLVDVRGSGQSVGILNSANRLKPIVDSPPGSEFEAKTAMEPVAVGLPPLSAADMHALTRSVVDTPSLASHQSVDLSELELESNLAAKPFPPASHPKEQPEQIPLTATEHLSETIRLIEETVGERNDLGKHHGAEPGVRLLQILRQKLEQASSSDWRLSEQEHQCWQQQLEAVSLMFESGSITTPDGDRAPQRQNATQAIEHLESAARHLRSMAGLKVYGGQLCSQILGFGKFEELESKQFQLGDRALIYVEIENQSSQMVSSDPSSASNNQPTFQTRLQASYAVHDSAGKIVHQETYPAIEDLARRHRRDFYLHLPITIAQLSPGEYQIAVSVEDLGNANAATLSAIDISIIQPTQ